MYNSFKNIQIYNREYLFQINSFSNCLQKNNREGKYIAGNKITFAQLYIFSKNMDNRTLQQASQSQQSLSQQEAPKAHETEYSDQKPTDNDFTINPVTGKKISSTIEPSQLIKQLQIKRQLNEFEIGQLMYLMFYILNYPSLGEAQVHALANRMGSFDVKKEKDKEWEGKGREFCKCCGYVKQEESIPLCTGFDSFPSVGISTYLFFQTIKNLIFLLILALVVHGLYALITNLLTAKAFISSSTLKLNSLISWISLDSKVTASNIDNQGDFNLLYMIEMWIGVGLVVLWSLFLYLIRYYERKYEVMVDKETVTAADFSVIIENYPRKLSKEGLQKQLDAYAQKLECENQDIFRIEKISMNSDTEMEKIDEEEMEEINGKYNEMLDIFADWVCELQENGYLPYDYQKRTEIYQKFQRIKGKRLKKGKKILETLLMKSKTYYRNVNGENGSETANEGPYNGSKQINNSELIDGQTSEPVKQTKTIAIVTFKYSNSKDLMSKHNSMDFAKTIRHFIRCCPVKNKLTLLDQKNMPRNIKIEKAPQPEDVKWQNLSISVFQKLIRKAGTYISTLILLSISFALVYYLSVYEANNKTNESLNFVISFVISLINFVIGFLIRFLTIFEKDYTETGYQTSLAIKSIWAQLLNSIVVPIIVNYIIEEKNIFGQNGLSNDIIFLAITNSFLPPLTKLIDPYHKYTLLRALYFRKSLKQRLLMKQIELNESQEYMQFETGYEYIYFINLYLFTAFFVTLQPLISLFAISGMFFMYWIQKYALMYRMRRPVPGTDLVNTAMSQMINLGPIFFSIGALSWSHLLDGYKVPEGVISYYVPNIITASLAALFFIFPFNVIFDKYLPNVELENLDYEDCRILLNSEYDRTNPATMEKAIKEYEEFLETLMGEEEEEQKKQQQKEKDKKVIGFADMDPDEQNSRKSKIGSALTIGTIVKNIAVDKTYLNRKKEILRNRTRIRSKLAADPMHSMIDDVVEDQKGKGEQEKEKEKEREIAGKPKNIFNLENHLQREKSSLKQKQKQKEKEKVVKKVMIRSSHQPQITIHAPKQLQPQSQIPPEKPIQDLKLKKQRQQKPKRVNLDFRAFLPLENTDAFFQNSPQNSRNDDYLNYFGKKFSMGSELTDMTKENQKEQLKRAGNPYEKAFY